MSNLLIDLGELVFVRIKILTILSLDFRTLDNGGLDFHTERAKQNCCNEDVRSVEDIGPQEEGASSVLFV